jgi:2'-5' RNA ligase
VLFLGAVSETLLPPLRAALSQLRLPAFEQALTRLEFWDAGRLCCAAGEAVVGLRALRLALENAAAGAGLAIDARELRAHVTLARARATASDREVRPLAAPVLLAASSVVLAQSSGAGSGPRYRPLVAWPLGVE